MFKSILRKLRLKAKSERKFKFLLFSFSLSYVFLLLFSLLVDGDMGLETLGYLLTIPLYYYLLILVITMVLMPIFLVKKLFFLILIPKIAFDILLLADFFVFRIYRFHIDSLFINMLLHDFQGLGISWALISFSVFAASLIAAVNIYVYKKVKNKETINLRKVNLSIFAVFLIGQLGHVISYEYKYVPITQVTPYFPYYKPLTSSSAMAKLQASLPSVFPKREQTTEDSVSDLLAKQNSSGLLTYPRQALTFSEENERPNILLFVAESWRQDSLTSEITPNIAKFTQAATNFHNHYSSGSVTVNGLYGLMYGLHPVYRNYMDADPYRNQTMLTKSLKQLGYDIDVYTSSNLNRFSLKELFFGHIADENYHNIKEFKMEVNDQKVVQQLIEDLKKPTDKPWFKFVFVSSSHHSYTYPKEFEKFTPIEKNPEAFVFNKYMDGTGLFNDFKNSMHFIDSLFGDIRDAMLENGLDKNTMTIVTSDHGEEFNDNKAGYWGHGSNFTSYQVAVPMAIKMPQQSSRTDINKLSSHIDVVPTILTKLGVNNSASDYANGVDLFDLPNQRAGLIFSSYKSTAYLVDDFVYAFDFSVSSYHKNDVKKENEKYNYKGLHKLKQEEQVMLKH